MKDDKKTAAAPAGPPKMRRVKITHYKVQTSSGRLLAGDYGDLPDAEAADLIARKHAVAVDADKAP